MPILLLSKIEKILERIVHNHFYKLFEDNKLTYNLQFGLKKLTVISFKGQY